MQARRVATATAACDRGGPEAGFLADFLSPKLVVFMAWAAALILPWAWYFTYRTAHLAVEELRARRPAAAPTKPDHALRRLESILATLSLASGTLGVATAFAAAVAYFRGS